MPKRTADQEILCPMGSMRELAKLIGLNWRASKKLYHDKLMSYDPELMIINSTSRAQELIFLGTLVAAGCDRSMLKRLLEKLEKPYCYDLSGMYYDWVSKSWKDHDSLQQSMAKIISKYEEDGDGESLKELMGLIQESINKLIDVPGKRFRLAEDDYVTVGIAKNIAYRFLDYPKITPDQKKNIRKALDALEQLPIVKPRTDIDLGIACRSVDKDYKAGLYVNFMVSQSFIEIRAGSRGNELDQSWLVTSSGDRLGECDLSIIEHEIEEYLNIGAKITVNDKSKHELDTDMGKEEIMPSDIKLQLLKSLQLRYDDSVNSYGYPFQDLIEILEDPKYDKKHKIIRNSDGIIIEYRLFFKSPPETWKSLCGREGIYRLDPVTLHVKRFYVTAMS